MDVQTVPAPAPLLRPRRVWLMLLVAVVAASVMVAPYVLLDVGSSRLAVDGGLHYALLVTHIVTATVALVLGLTMLGTGVLARADAATAATSLIPIGQVLGWAINLVVAEVLIRRPLRSARPVRQASRSPHAARGRGRRKR